ncbi:hypothetical protein CK203_034486 [Vitis vinifera]|uniref:Reverse transcriptase zinc-binding domain-containing protein n=1 Tax=Vitis vinifera TaxID=29760 RepID=A0A438HZE1_VITVI|nr:hypothetical protein CK203_034486 [Vitis vinifera]
MKVDSDFHLLFADDTLVFCQASQDQLTYLSWLLMWFEAASGMRINLDKSELIPVGRVVDIDDLALDFGCKVGSLPSTYLGLPLGAPFKSVAMWDGVEERFRKRLTMWKRQYLSKGGRATLIGRGLAHAGSERGAWRGALERIRMDWDLVGARISFSVGNGRRVSFWRDRWCGDAPLCDSFPSIYALSIEKEAWVADVWDPLVQGEADCPSSFPSSCIWKVWVQPKISFFAWEAAWGKALTLDLVQRRGWSLANRCYMCMEKEETIDHLLLHCSKTRVLWELLFSLFGVSWVMPCSVRETLLSWQTSSVGKNTGKCGGGALHIFWTVWKARNRLAFKDDDISIQRLKYSFLCSLWSEAKLFIVECPQTLVNFIDWVGSL